MEQKTLRRSATNQVIAGVCGGIGEYFNIDPTLVRVIFIILALASGSGLILYIILWIIIPGPTTTSTNSQDVMKENLSEMEQKIEQFAGTVEAKLDGETSKDVQEAPKPTRGRQDSQFWLGAVLVIVGGWFLLSNLGFLRIVRVDLIWPIILVFFGVYFLTGRK
jgi:phage shock protein PspC (stress-responsive transcriptional regulator)